MDVDHAQLLPEFDAVCACTSRNRVIIKRMAAYLADGWQNVFEEMEEMVKYILSPTDTEGTISVLTWSACDHEGRISFVAVKGNKTTFVANMKQFAGGASKAGHEEHQELPEAQLMSEALGDLRGKICQEISDLDERISVEEIDLVEKNQVMKELLKERRSTEVEEWRDTVVAGGVVTQKAAAGSRTADGWSPSVRCGSSSKRYRGHSCCWEWGYLEGLQLGPEAPKRRVILLLSDVEVMQKKDTEEDQSFCGQVKALIWVESAETHTIMCQRSH